MYLYIQKDKLQHQPIDFLNQSCMTFNLNKSIMHNIVYHILSI